MRPVTAPLVLGALLAASPAYADCIGPLECFCSFTSTTATPVGIGVVQSTMESGDVLQVEIEVESVHGPEGAVAPGDVLTTALTRDTEIGDRLLFYLDADNPTQPWAFVEERDDGSVACSGFSSEDLTLTDVVEARTSTDCYATLTAKDAEFDVPECNDVVTGPFGCDASGAAGAAPFAALAGLLALARRRRG